MKKLTMCKISVSVIWIWMVRTVNKLKCNRRNDAFSFCFIFKVYFFWEELKEMEEGTVKRSSGIRFPSLLLKIRNLLLPLSLYLPWNLKNIHCQLLRQKLRRQRELSGFPPRTPSLESPMVSVSVETLCHLMSWITKQTKHKRRKWGRKRSCPTDKDYWGAWYLVQRALAQLTDLLELWTHSLPGSLVSDLSSCRRKLLIRFFLC